MELVLWMGGVLGLSIVGQLLAALPATLFLRREKWISETELAQIAPEKARLMALFQYLLLGWAGMYVIAFSVMLSVAPNTLLVILSFLMLFFLWMYLPVGFLELVAGVSVRFAPRLSVTIGARTIGAGITRLTITAAVFGAVALTP